jgi:hypothetical protein
MACHNELAKHPGAKFGNCFPLTHEFTEGLYIRTIFVPAGALVVTHIFRQSHVTLMTKGRVSVATEEGVKEVSAPFRIITKAGTKRVIYCHEDVEWTTIHANPTDTTDIKTIEDFVTVQSYEGLELTDSEKKVAEIPQTC